MAANLPTVLYDCVMKIATAEGQHPTAIMESFVAQGVVAYNNQVGEKAPTLVKVYTAVSEMRNRQQAADMLRLLVQAEVKSPDEDRWARLQQLADEAGVNIKDFIDDISHSAVLSALAGSTSSISPAQQLLIDLIPTNNIGVPVNAIYEACKQRGISKDAVRNARTQLGVETYKNGMPFFWRWPEKFDPQAYVRQLTDSYLEMEATH